MYYVQFFRKSAISDDLIEGCGDRSVIILDGRESRGAMAEFSANECEKRGFLAWQIFRGETFIRSCSISCIHRVCNDIDNSASIATHGA